MQEVEGVSRLSGEDAEPDGGEQQPECPRHDALDHGAPAQRPDDGHAEQADGADLGEGELKDERLDDRDHQQQGNGADQPAHGGNHVDEAEHVGRLSLGRQGSRLEEGHLAAAGMAEHHDGQDIEHLFDAGDGGQHDDSDHRVSYGEDDERDRQRHEKARGNAGHDPRHGGHGHGGEEREPVLFGRQPIQPGKDSIHLKNVSPLECYPVK